MKREEDHLANKYPISVVIPCYNAAETVGDCLNALLINDLRNVELIVVDDASNDGTADLVTSLNSYSKGGIRLIRLSMRSGPGAARNTGMESSSHPHLFFLDADILLPKQAIRWLRESLDLYSHQEKVVGALGTYAERVPGNGFLTVFKNLYTCYLYRMTDTISPFIHTPMFAVRKEILEREGAFDPDMFRAEDFKLGAVLGSKGYRFIIDWRIKGTHLKTYRFLGMLREDWHRIAELKRIQLTAEQRRFSYRAHRWSRILALVLPGITVLAATLGVIWTPSLWVAGAAFLLFLLVNSGFFLYVRSRQGISFAARSVAFLFIEMLWAQVALVFSGLR